MITLEKILLLKSMTFFREVSDELLMSIAESSLEEQVVRAGEMLFCKGSEGRHIYIIVSGRVKVHDGDTILAELGERESFGTFAALSLGKRTASVTAITDGLLLKIASDELYELMSLEVGLAKGIIKALCETISEILGNQHVV